MLSFRPLLLGSTGGWLGKVGRSMATTRIVFQPSPTPVETAHKHTDSPVTSSSGLVPDVSNIPSAYNDDDEVVVPLRALKGKSSRNSVRHFVDWIEVTVCAGDGGDGSISLNSLYANEFAGPDGGDGGSGGHVILTANPAFRDLSHVKSKLIAARGGAGKSNKCEGKDAQHLVVQVPVGTILRNLEGALIADLDRDGVSFIAARGGGRGEGEHLLQELHQEKTRDRRSWRPRGAVEVHTGTPDHGRRWPDRISKRWQVYPADSNIKGQTQSGSVPVHHLEPPHRHGPIQRPHPTCSCRSARPAPRST